MANIKLRPKKNLKGEITVPADKSISHRAIMCGALANGVTSISNLLLSDDCMSTIECFRKLGVRIEGFNNSYLVYGKGLNGLKACNDVLYTGNSGTTTRLISGILAGQNFESILDGDISIRKRPMNRIITPLTNMGSLIKSQDGFCPMTIKGGNLKAINYTMPISSAQVKSCIIFASLFAEGKSTIIEKEISRDHTERMLSCMGADVKRTLIDKGAVITINKASELKAQQITVPADISSAAFLIGASLITENSEIIIKNVGVNPTRTGVLDVFKRMGADISLINVKNDNEPIADIVAKSSNLNGTTISGAEIPLLIDEIPIIAAVASLAKGVTVIKDAKELKVKESNRIDSVCEMLNNFGVKVEKTDDGMIIEGSNSIKGDVVNSYNDHRIAMTGAVLSMVAKGETEIINGDCCSISFPNFYDLINNLGENA